MGVAITGKRGPVRPDSRNVVRGEATRQRILGAARTRILADGFEALRLDALARDAGITKAAVIKSVGGKARILLTLGDEDRQTRLEVIRRDKAAYGPRAASRGHGFAACSSSISPA
jgi:AcrR family transcriptional regulator